MKEAEKKLGGLGEKILKDVDKGVNPNIDIPIRALSNVIHDPKTGMLTLGEKSAKRFFFHTAHAKKFMQTLVMASFCNELLKENIHTSIRDAYYALKRTLPNSDENIFETQVESNSIIVDLEVALNILREQLHLAADVRGKVAGKLVIVDRGDTIDCSKMGSGGWGVPSVVEDIKLKKVDADFVLVVEKNAVYERLNEDRFWQKHKSILVTSQGQAARGVRRLIQRLSLEHNLPVYVLTDANSWGWYIYSVIKYGSITLAHISDRLGTINAKFIGMTISDIERFGLQKFTERATEVDIKRAQEMLKYEWFKHPAWQKELKLLIQKKIKAEIEALSGRGLRFITEEYLPTKIKNQEFLP
ncbi:MAG: DNA topoisomerase IV subunit A [Candidatus Aenigmarchaeota archaeon]|nr:DNA topoisomerase IV subunit A [Candidatus Aenigmarchaeota archaeon]